MIVTGVLYTLNDEHPQAEAVAITEGRFSYVGNREQALERRGPQTHVIELGERVAYPGFIDAHLHVAGIGAAQRAVNLSGAQDFADIIARIAERASTLREGVTVTGHGWHQSKWQRPPSGGVGWISDSPRAFRRGALAPGDSGARQRPLSATESGRDGPTWDYCQHRGARGWRRGDA